VAQVAAVAQAGVGEKVRAATVVLAGCGIPVPTVLACFVIGATEVILFELVEGIPGPDLLDDPVRGPLLARAMGAQLALLSTADPGDHLTDTSWASAPVLVESVRSWCATLRERVPPVAVRAARRRVTAQVWRPVVVHGDFVPANVIVADGRIVALIDLAGVALGHPLLDAAWWALVVRHHHASLAPRLEPLLLASAGIPTAGPQASLLPHVALLRAVELAADSVGPRREHQLRLLETAQAWSAAALIAEAAARSAPGPKPRTERAACAPTHHLEGRGP